MVDNGSTDGAAELARARGAGYIAMGRNAGFAVAVNRGIPESRGRWVAVLNSDVKLAPDYFEALLGAAEGRKMPGLPLANSWRWDLPIASTAPGMPSRAAARCGA